MLYFKTKKGRLIVQIEISSNEYLYMVVPVYRENRLPAQHYSWTNERVWKIFEKKSVPKQLEENTEDFKNYQEVNDLENEFQQEMSEWEWMMSMAIHHRRF